MVSRRFKTFMIIQLLLTQFLYHCAFSDVITEPGLTVASEDLRNRGNLYYLNQETPTAVPKYTPTVTPTPNDPVLSHDKFETRLLVSSLHDTDLIDLDPNAGELVLAHKPINDNQIYLYRFMPPETPIDFNNLVPFIKINGINIKDHKMHDISIAPDSGISIGLSENDLYESFIYISPDNQYRQVQFSTTYFAFKNILAINDNIDIPDLKTSDVLINDSHFNQFGYADNKLSIFNPKSETPMDVPFISPDELPEDFFIQDFAQGSNGELNILVRLNNGRTLGNSKLFSIDADKQLHEEIHEVLFIDGYHLVYHPYEDVYYITSESSGEDGRLIRIGNTIEDMGNISWAYDRDLIPDPNRPRSYFLQKYTNGNVGLYAMEMTEEMTPTPTPCPIEPLPTPRQNGWFVLDGFGGIHTTNPEIEKPILPYWPSFAIARDIEPDPSGNGWYMLDGYGGIHSDPQWLPKPDDLPYFGFDIARNLEIAIVDGQRHFYLLDGFGVIHTTDENFDSSAFPFFYEDAARDLELWTEGIDPMKCFPDSEWLVLDHYGNIFSENGRADTIRMVHPNLISPVMRAFHRFPDETTVMMDYFAGRHTNPYFPADNVVDGLPTDFYFYGWDIIWDMEYVTEN